MMYNLVNAQKLMQSTGAIPTFQYTNTPVVPKEVYTPGMTGKVGIQELEGCDPIFIVKLPKQYRLAPPSLNLDSYLRSTWFLKHGSWQCVESRQRPHGSQRINEWVERALFQFHPLQNTVPAPIELTHGQLILSMLPILDVPNQQQQHIHSLPIRSLQVINALTRIAHGGRGDPYSELSHDFQTASGESYKGFREYYQENQPSRVALLATNDVPEDSREWGSRKIKRVHNMPRKQLYLPLDVIDCPIDPKFFRDTRTTVMLTKNEDGSTTEATIQDPWRCLSDASDLRQEREWTGYTEFQVSSRFRKHYQEGSQQPESMFSLAVIPKELQTGKEAVDIFDEVKIRNDVCKTNKHLRLGFGDRRNRPRDGKLELLLCEEDQHDDRLGNIYMTLICADERRPRLVLVCSEEINWFTKLEKTVGQYMTIVTITADDDLLSLYGVNKVRACLRDENDVMFFAGPCTGGSSWARLNKMRSIETAMLIRRRQIMFWKLFDVFAHLMKRRDFIKFKSLLELPRHCDYWKDPRMTKLTDTPDSFINDFDGCCYGLREQYSHPPRYIKKPWRIVSWGVDFGDSLSKKCDGRHEHAPCAGRETIGTQVYTSNIVSTILKKLNEDIDSARIVLSDGESRRSPLKVRARGSKSKAACVVVLCVHRKADSPSELVPCKPCVDCADLSDLNNCHTPTVFVPKPQSTSPTSNPCGCRPIGERELVANVAEGIKDPLYGMTASASTPHPTQPIMQGSGGGMQDLFLTNDQKSIAKRSLAVIKTVFQLGNATTLPSFRLGIDMDLSHAMIWCQDAFKLPTIIALACWFMTGPVDDERSRVWLYNMHRYACRTDCERTIRQYVDKVKLVIKAFQHRIGTAEGQGVLECFADSEFLKRVDIFWDEFVTYVDSGKLPNVLMRSSLEDACNNLRDGTLVSTGYMLEHNAHELYKFKYRDADWHSIMRDYWNFATDLYVPNSSQVAFLRDKLVQCARELTLTIRLKNEMVKVNQGSSDEMLNERKLAKKITDRCFEGIKIAEETDAPMWAAVHLIMYYCSLSSLMVRALHSREEQRKSGRSYMAQDDVDVLKNALDHCGGRLPDLEGIKELGWNVFYAEVVDERGAYAAARNERLKGLREWVTWNNNPYDEQWKSSKTPEDRRGRHYEFGNEAADEFKTPERNMWPQWAVTSGLLDMYLMRHVPRRWILCSLPAARGSHSFMRS